MPGLVLKLAPKERVLINGAVVENGDRRCRVTILTSEVNILRLKDAIHPDEANTPVKRICYVLQLILSGDAEPGEGKAQVFRGLEQLSDALSDPFSRRQIDLATEKTQQGQFYAALKALRTLVGKEQRILGQRPV